MSLIDFRYCSDVLTKEEAIKLLRNCSPGKTEREENLLKNGYPAYTTAAGLITLFNPQYSSKTPHFRLARLLRGQDEISLHQVHVDGFQCLQNQNWSKPRARH